MILQQLVFEKILLVGFLLFCVAVEHMIVGFECAFELVGNFVNLLDFGIENYYCMTLADVLFVYG